MGRLTPAAGVRGNIPARLYRQGQPVPARRAGAGRDDGGENRYPARRDVPPDRPQARQAEAIVAVSRVIREIAWILICDPSARYQELGPDYYHPRSPARQTRDKIREIERLNPGKKVILADDDAA